MFDEELDENDNELLLKKDKLFEKIFETGESIDRRLPVERDKALREIGQSWQPKFTPLSQAIKENSKVKNGLEVALFKTKLFNLGYYQGELDNKTTIGMLKAMNDFAEDYQVNMRMPSKYLKEIMEKLDNVKSPARLDFDGKYLRFIQEGKTTLELDAMSGRKEYQDRKYQYLRDLGPLPEENYRVRQERIQDINLWQGVSGAVAKLINIKYGEAYGGYPAWGKTRVWLEPFSSNMMYGRDKFTIHGGYELGSAGCIDIAGHTKEFFDVLRKYGKDIILNVHYDQEKLR